MAIEDRNLKGGEKLVATYKGKQYTCSVRKGQPDEGGTFGLEYVVGGKTFTSPSAAGMHVRDGKATNGWAFWSLEGQEAKARAAAALHAKYGDKPSRAKTRADADVKASTKPTSIAEHREKKAEKKPTARKSTATCPECGETRKTAQGMASHMRAHARAATAAVLPEPEGFAAENAGGSMVPLAEQG